MPKLLGQFIETADAKALDAKCLDTLGLRAAVHQLQWMGTVMRRVDVRDSARPITRNPERTPAAVAPRARAWSHA